MKAVESSFGRYRLVEMLGQGGMGRVFRAYDTETSREVALKVLAPQVAADAAFQERFRREAQLAAQVNDPHVVPIHGFGEIEGQLFVDMRLIEGRDLASVLAEGRLDPTRAVRIIEQVADALDSAHRIGLVHRDIKPSNILLDHRDFVYLIDFGIAQQTGGTRLTNTGAAIGTFAYMAPERFETGGGGPGVDVYALACVLFECLTGSAPFGSGSMEQQVSGHLAKPPPRPSAVGVAAGFDVVIAAGMAKDLGQRYPSALGLAQAARAALEGRPVYTPAGQTQLSLGGQVMGASSGTLLASAQHVDAGVGQAATRYASNGYPAAGAYAHVPRALVAPKRSAGGTATAAAVLGFLGVAWHTVAAGRIAWGIVGTVRLMSQHRAKTLMADIGLFWLLGWPVILFIAQLAVVAALFCGGVGMLRRRHDGPRWTVWGAGIALGLTITVLLVFVGPNVWGGLPWSRMVMPLDLNLRLVLTIMPVPFAVTTWILAALPSTKLWCHPPPAGVSADQIPAVGQLSPATEHGPGAVVGSADTLYAQSPTALPPTAVSPGPSPAAVLAGGNQTRRRTLIGIAVGAVVVVAGVAVVAARGAGSSHTTADTVAAKVVELPFPEGTSTSSIAVDAAGAVYVVNEGTYTILKLPAGASAPAEMPQFKTESHRIPSAVAAGPAGDVYVVGTDYARNRDGVNTVWKLAAGQSEPVDLPFPEVALPIGIAVSARGDVYVTDLTGYNNKPNVGRVWMLAAGAPAPTMLPFPSLGSPQGGVAVNAAGDLYVADIFERGHLWKLAVGATAAVQIPDLRAMSMAIDQQGNLYGLDEYSSYEPRVWKVAAGTSTATTVSFPGLRHDRIMEAMAVDTAGNVYVADRDNEHGFRVQKLEAQ